MGTTGGDRHQLLEDTKNAGVYAVIAPQMGKQVCAVAFDQFGLPYDKLAHGQFAATSKPLCYA